MRGDFGLKAFEESAKGQRITAIIDDHVLEIEVLAKHGVAPVKAVDEPIAAEFGALANDEKQHVGRMIFKRLGTDKWEVASRSEFAGAVFTSGSTFRPRTTKPVVIRRKDPRPGGEEFPIKSPTGYQLVRPGLKADERTRAENAVSVQRLEEALPLLDIGYHIRMGRKGLRPSLIAKDSLIIE